MSSSYKLKSHPTQSLYDHITGVRDIALKTHKYHTIKPEIDDFIEVVCMCHDFGKGTTYFQRYLENDFRGIEKDHGPISAMFTYWMLPDKWKHLGFLIVKKHHGDINNASDECRIDEVSWDFKNQIKDILDNTIDELNQIYDKYLEGKNIEEFLNWLEDESNLKSIKKEFRKKKYNIYDARFCFENWQSKIISTTFVQLLNTIFKIGKNSIVNRFHRLANSVIILDEVQAIDDKYYKIISEFISIMARQYNCYIILVTATMPMLLDTIDLIEDKEKYFRKLNRINIINNSESEITLDEFEDIVLEDIRENKDKSFLIVLNTVKSSKNIYKYLKENTDRDIIYLSTEIYPKLRLEKINKIKNRNKKYVVVSTQLIEAGVDIDMDIVYRDFSTLDSINQTAGRANRNGVGGKGIVKLYKIVDNDRRICNYIYPRYLLNATEEVLDGKYIIEEKDIYDCNKEYFLKVKNRLSNDTSDELLDLILKLQFKKFRDKFELIENDEFRRVDIIVNADNITNSIIQQLENDNEIDNIDLKNKFRILRQYTVSVSRKEMSEINDIDIIKYSIKYINKEDYSEEEGIIRQKQVIW